MKGGEGWFVIVTISLKVWKTLQECLIMNKRSWKTKTLPRIVDRVLSNGMLVHQLAYTKKVLKHFHINKSYLLNSPIIIVHLK